MIIISGEKIQMICDFHFGNKYDFDYNKNINQNKKQILLSSSTVPKSDQKILTIFIYTHLLGNNIDKSNVIRLLLMFNSKLILFFHNSDGVFTNNDIDLLNIKNVIKIYSQNIICPLINNLIPLPIGQANIQWIHGNTKQLLNVINKYTIKNNDIFLNFNINTNSIKRLLCYKTMLSKNIPNIIDRNYEDYLNLLHTYKFAICPEGNGPDTHRFWECLYLKVIPICLKNYITEYYSKIFPIVLLNSWDELNINELKYIEVWDNYEMLSLDNIF